jgi:hypothetical protein
MEAQHDDVVFELDDVHLYDSNPENTKNGSLKEAVFQIKL